MCIKNYVGYGCGHRDPEGTVLKTTYCRQSFRYGPGTPCDVFTYRVHVHVDQRRPRDSEFCPACRVIRSELRQEWTRVYMRWSREGLVSMQDRLDTHTRIENNFRYVELKAKEAVLSQGGNHPMQGLYRERQDAILRPIEQQAQRLRTAHMEWKVKTMMAKQDGKVSRVFLDVLCIKRKAYINITRPVPRSVDTLLARQAELLDELKQKEEKADAAKEEKNLSPN
ncbi:uncharacterized protein PG998_007644 [Apiospora kogelbergensis]|uniref:Uncharacterized protein n=1 Tax=Apiospora kogelbergensis TaxID=1337665 RepID=A0AAW0QF01_9PEZI